MARQRRFAGRPGSRRTWAVRAAVGLLLIAVPLLVGMRVGAKEQLTASELAVRADKICAQAAEELGPLFAELFPTGSEVPEASEAAPVLAQVERILAAQVWDLTRLKPPQELKADWHDVERLMRQMLHHARRAAQLARQGDTEGYLAEVTAANEVDAEVRQAFERIGAHGCAGST